jgi:F-type H+-transporting ATPase subunit epsilon
MALTLEIVTPERRVAQLTCDEVRAPGALGGFGIRPSHASFMSALEPGLLTVITGGREEQYSVSGGFLQVDSDRVIVLAEAAERREEIDVERARRALAESTARLRALTEQDPTHAIEAARVRRAAARIQIASR